MARMESQVRKRIRDFSWRREGRGMEVRMQYLFGEKISYEDFSSGRVLYSSGGVPNFPVRLQAEIFGRALEHADRKRELCVYDPCCGGGYSLAVLGFLAGDRISCLYGSDIDPSMLAVAEKNLSLLSAEGMDRRMAEIESLYEAYHKDSHRQALESCKRLRQFDTVHIEVELFQADCTEDLPVKRVPDLILTDIPYGSLVRWNDPTAPSADRMLEKLFDISREGTILAVCMDKKQRVLAGRWNRLEKISVGKRRIEIFGYGS